MSSLFISLRSDHHEEKISGDEAAPPPPSAQSETGGWLSGLISGAGKLISSVIGPDYSSSSSLDSSDDDDDDDDDVDLVRRLQADHFYQFVQMKIREDKIQGYPRYKSTPPCGVPLVKEETTNMRHPAHSSKVLKRNQETSVSEDALDNSRRVSIRPTGNLLSISKFTKVNFPSGYSDNEASRIPSEAGQGGIEEALLGINNYTNCSSTKRSFDEALNLSFKNHNTSVAPVETPILTALPLGPIPYQVGRYPIFRDSIFLAPDKHKDPQEPSLVNKQVWNASTPLDSHAMAIKQEEHDEFVLDDSSSVPKLMLKEDIDAAPCSSPEQRTEHPVGYKRRRRCSAETTSCHQTNSCRGQLGNGAVLKENQQMLIEGQASTVGLGGEKQWRDRGEGGER
ncbi:hypothetical protein ACMD2_08075 [Ananas comosus]|uniref:Uncharacterized protein n=1 Tax=Ananas comosus TaxID=4615 RepID=A0A199VFT0_ANACO|nr:hypothetical protein ACMD2_08075 [Ananas comosus]